MEKNFKYILIFIFIVCLLIPISCINIFAVNYTAYTYYYHSSISSSQSYDDIATFENWEKIIIDNTEYINNGQYSTLYLNVRTRTNYSITFNIYAYNINTSSYSYFLQISNITLRDTYNKMYLDKIQIYYNDNTYLHIYSSYSNNASLSGYGNRLVYNRDYYVKDYFSNNDYYYIQSYYGSSLYYTYKFDAKFILATPSVISFNKTYNLSFYNNDILYDSITISGASASGYAPYEEISQIKYGNTIVYDNSVWSSGYNSTLRYNQNMTMPDVMQLNIDCDNIVTFYVQLYYVYSEYSQTYNIGTFYNKSQEFNSIQVNGLTIGDNKFSSIDTIYYNDIKVYENNNFINSFDENLYYMYNNINISDINTACNNIVIFTKTHIQPTTDDDILYGVGNILTIIKDFANMLLLNKVTIYCCVAIPLLSFAVFIVVKLKNGNDGDNKIN